MSAIFDRWGKQIGWLRDITLYDTNRNFIAFIQNEGIFRYEDYSLTGYFIRGYVTDLQGKPVAFVNGARGGPIYPPVLEPIPQSLPTPTPPFRPFPPITPILSISWSYMTWREFLNQH